MSNLMHMMAYDVNFNACDGIWYQLLMHVMVYDVKFNAYDGIWCQI